MNNLSIRLSNRQYSLLKTLASQSGVVTLDEQQAGAFNQQTFRSMLVRKWLVWDGHLFVFTEKGRDAVRAFDTESYLRKVSSMKLTSYFDRRVHRADLRLIPGGRYSKAA